MFKMLKLTLVRAWFHVPVPVHFFWKTIGGLVKKGWCHVPIPLTQGLVPLMDTGSTFCVVQEHVPTNQQS
jgi:hypothetical protein